MKKLIKNKFMICIISVIVISIVYFIVEKAIDNYNFYSNNEENTNDEIELLEVNDKLDDNSKKLDEDSNDLEKTEEESVIEDIEEIENEDIVKGAEKASKNKIYVHIIGEVNNPGVVILNEGSRMIDAINAAGGTTSNANITKINLVYILEDGMKVNIPNNSDFKNDTNFEYITKSSGDGKSDNSLSSVSSSEKNNSEMSINSDSSSLRRYTVININKATQTELETLPGIGPSLALNIINYRKENGKFSSIDEIKNVSGIGDNKFEKLKSYIKV